MAVCGSMTSNDTFHELEDAVGVPTNQSKGFRYRLGVGVAISCCFRKNE